MSLARHCGFSKKCSKPGATNATPKNLLRGGARNMLSTFDRPPSSAPRRRVVITGLGPITCVGVGKDAVWANIRGGRSGIGRISSFDTGDLRARCGGEILDWDPLQFFAPHRLKRLDRYAQF